MYLKEKMMKDINELKTVNKWDAIIELITKTVPFNNPVEILKNLQTDKSDLSILMELAYAYAKRAENILGTAQNVSEQLVKKHFEDFSLSEAIYLTLLDSSKLDEAMQTTVMRSLAYSYYIEYISTDIWRQSKKHNLNKGKDKEIVRNKALLFYTILVNKEEYIKNYYRLGALLVKIVKTAEAVFIKPVEYNWHDGLVQGKGCAFTVINKLYKKYFNEYKAMLLNSYKFEEVSQNYFEKVAALYEKLSDEEKKKYNNEYVKSLYSWCRYLIDKALHKSKRVKDEFCCIKEGDLKFISMQKHDITYILRNKIYARLQIIAKEKNIPMPVPARLLTDEELKIALRCEPVQANHFYYLCAKYINACFSYFYYSCSEEVKCNLREKQVIYLVNSVKVNTAMTMDLRRNKARFNYPYVDLINLCLYADYGKYSDLPLQHALTRDKKIALIKEEGLALAKAEYLINDIETGCNIKKVKEECDKFLAKCYEKTKSNRIKRIGRDFNNYLKNEGNISVVKQNKIYRRALRNYFESNPKMLKEIFKIDELLKDKKK